jgi:hypothetical protein
MVTNLHVGESARPGPPAPGAGSAGPRRPARGPGEGVVRVVRARPLAPGCCDWCWPRARQYPACGVTESARGSGPRPSRPRARQYPSCRLTDTARVPGQGQAGSPLTRTGPDRRPTRLPRTRPASILDPRGSPGAGPHSWPRRGHRATPSTAHCGDPSRRRKPRNCPHHVATVHMASGPRAAEQSDDPARPKSPSGGQSIRHVRHSQ